jgi:membrane complex biogenesis BtpA family protein
MPFDPPTLLPQWPRSRKVVIGMIHLLPLPGSPRYGGDVKAVREAALRDAAALHEGGVHGLMIENFGDVPFYPSRVPAYVVAHMTAIAAEVRARIALPLGINVLRNDGLSAIAVAHACGAEFIRVNVLCGARVADQGLLQGIAHDLLRERSLLGITAGDVKILADVDVKHSAPLAARDIADEVDDTVKRGLADGVIVSGAGTGKKTDPEKVRAVKACAGADVPVFVGSGITAETIGKHAPFADGFIVGTAFKRDGDPTNPVEVDRVRKLVAALA